MAGKAKRPESTVVDERSKKIKAMLVALETEDGLSQWEQDFVANTADTFTNGKTLTDKWYERLEIIYRKFN